MSRFAIAFFVVALLAPVGSQAREFDVVYHEGSTYHVAINILEIDLLAVNKEAIYRRIAGSICEAPPCTVKFWLDKALAAKTVDIADRQQQAMVAEYVVAQAGIEMVYHHQISKIGDVVADAECVKEIFNLYCLGGDVSELPEPESVDSEGSKETRFYSEATVVTSFKGKVAEVARIYDSMTWLEFASLQSKLEGIYGEAQDLSYFPNYADSPDAKETAIQIGSGKASLLWAQDGWSVSLMWFERAAALVYEHGALQRAMDAVSDDDGF